MTLENILPALIMAAAALIAALIAIQSWRWRATPGGLYFAILMAAVAIYALTNAVKLVIIDPNVKIALTKLSYVGIVSLAPAWLLFTLSYSRSVSRLSSRRMIALWALPVAILALAATNEWHHLIWASILPVSTEMGIRLIYTHGPVFWIHAAYAYVLIITGTYWLIRATLGSTILFRRQVLALVIAALIPWLCNLFYVLNLGPGLPVDLTPLAFLVSGLIVAWNIYYFKMLKLAPVARDVLFESLGDGVIVLDEHDRVIDLNPTARRWMEVGDEAVGRNIFDLVKLNDVSQISQSPAGMHTQLEIGEGDQRRVYDLTSSVLRDAHGDLQGQVVLLHDISRERDLLDAMQHRARQMELLNSITRAALSERKLQDMLQTLADQLGELFDADGAYLTLWDEDQHRTVPVRAYGPLREMYQSIKPKPDEKTMTEHVLSSGHALAIEDVFNSPYLSPRIAALFPAKSNLALPLIADGEKLGAAIVAFNQTHRFNQDEIALGELAAGQIALAVAKVKLYEVERHRASQLAALQSISQAVASSLELKQIFDTVVRVLHESFNYPYVSIYRLDGDILRMGAQAGYPADIVFPDIPIKQGISGRAVREMRPQFVQDVTADPDFLAAAQDVGSEICVPLLKEQTVFGTLNIESPPTAPLTQMDLQILIAFGNQVVIAIENARLYAEVQRLAVVDELTGLYNRRGFFDLGRRELERATRLDHPLTALFLDIDEFKSFNDVFGYAIGDRVLHHLADCLRANLREIDLIGRYGGEEFVVLLPDTELDSAQIVAERVRGAVENAKIETAQGKIGITISVGVCARSPRITGLSALIDQAGKALQAAKKSGRNRVIISDKTG